MKILQLINNLGSGGAEKLISEYTPKMLEFGHSVDILLVCKKNSTYTKLLTDKNIKVTCLNEKYLFNPIIIIRLYKYLKKNNYDIIHIHLFPSLYYIYIVLLFFKNNKTIFTEHAVSNDRQKYILFRLIDSYIYNSFNKVICLSESVKANLIQKIRLKEDKCSIIPNGINLSPFKCKYNLKKSDISSKIKDEDFLIIMVARLTYQKDQKTLIKAISLLPNNYKLLLVGEGEKKENILSYIDILNLNERVFLLGRRTDVPALISICNIGVLSSRVEGMPLFALEVMASKKPFIGSDVPGISDLFKNVGIIFKFEDHAELASIISSLSSNEKLYEEYSNRSFEFSKNCSIEQMAVNYLDLYKKTTNNE